MRRITGLLLLAGATSVIACGDAGPGDGTLKAVQVSFATQSAGAAQLGVAGVADDTTIAGSDMLIITRVQIVLREIELRRLGADSCDSTVTGDDDACEEFETGPVLVDLPLTPGVQQRFALDIPAGTYTEIEFDIHKPEDSDSADAAFIATHPAFERISIRVQGTYNGRAFVHTTDLNVEQELALVPALTISDATATTNITIFVDLDRWYRVAGAVVDPAEANKGGTFESEVNENIKISFEAFEDDDRDGIDD